ITMIAQRPATDLILTQLIIAHHNMRPMTFGLTAERQHKLALFLNAHPVPRCKPKVRCLSHMN
ncbi:hypothetical protein LXA25_18680, partial [Erwinia amylovora]|nr:hypothetical protein [Erwinia amylovora]